VVAARGGRTWAVDRRTFWTRWKTLGELPPVWLFST